MTEQDQNSPENDREEEVNRYPEQDDVDGGPARDTELQSAGGSPERHEPVKADEGAPNEGEEPIDSDDREAGGEMNTEAPEDRTAVTDGEVPARNEEEENDSSHEATLPSEETSPEKPHDEPLERVTGLTSEGQNEPQDMEEGFTEVAQGRVDPDSSGEEGSLDAAENKSLVPTEDEPVELSTEGADGATADDEAEGIEENLQREEVVDDLAHIIESIVFASDEPLPVGTIKSVLDAAHTFGRVNANAIIGRINALNAKYDEDGSGFLIVEIANGYQYATRKEMAQWVSILFKERSKRRLSNSALETLAIISYKQPITKPEIESIRGVSVDYVLHNLLEKELVTVVGRAESVGRPLLYGTTQRFLKIFALKSLDDLPRLREIDEIIKEIKSRGAEESIQLEITALGDSSSSEPAGEPEARSGVPSENENE